MTTDRQKRIASLRRLADLLEQCPDLPCPADVFISLREGGDEQAVETLVAAEEQLAARGIKVRREPRTHTEKQHAISFDLGGCGFTYDAFRVFKDSRVTAVPKAVA